MDIKHALLGFLSWQPATGYELKKLISRSVGFEWSGNNNQIYTSLIQLHREGLATSEIQAQDRYPSRKVYSITETGRKALLEWVTDNPEPVQFRKDFLIRLAWSDQIDDQKLGEMLHRYETEIGTQILMLREQIKRGLFSPDRTDREKYLWDRIAENYLLSYETELKWVQETITGIENKVYEHGQEYGR